MSKPILCLDFDGVLHSYSSGWHGANFIPDPPVPGAIEWLVEATEHFSIAIFSSRSNQEGGLEAMKAWLKYWIAKSYPMGTVDTYKRAKGAAAFNSIQWPLEKPSAFVTIDDRALTFNGDWGDPQFLPLALLAFKPWNK